MPNPPALPIVPGSPRSKLKLGMDVFCWYRGHPEPFPAKVIVCNANRLTLGVFSNRFNGCYGIVDHPRHASERIGAIKETFWDFSETPTAPTAQAVAVTEQKAEQRETQADKDARLAREKEAERKLHKEQAKQRAAKNAKAPPRLEDKIHLPACPAHPSNQTGPCVCPVREADLAEEQEASA